MTEIPLSVLSPRPTLFIYRYSNLVIHFCRPFRFKSRLSSPSHATGRLCTEGVQDKALSGEEISVMTSYQQSKNHFQIAVKSIYHQY